MNVLITTTINIPTVLTKWAAGLTKDDYIIVAGDRKSPHTEILDLLFTITQATGVNTRYLLPEDQTGWLSSDVIGWNCIQRRNIALLEAIKLKPEFIITIDDDNIPITDDQIPEIIRRMTDLEMNDADVMVKSSTGWYNPGEIMQPLNVTHRGFPQWLRHIRGEYEFAETLTDTKIGVGAMLWTGDPDIDAIERMCCQPLVSSISFNTILTPGIWAPFNSQATVYRGELAPLMLMWPGVGRYDDIWASYLARKVMDQFGWSVYYGAPVVNQERNEHDLMVDLSAEFFGMTFNKDVVDALQAIDLEDAESTIIGSLTKCFMELSRLDFLTTRTKESFGTWIEDLKTAGV